MHMMSRQDRSAVAAYETIGLLRRVRTLTMQQTPGRDYLPSMSCVFTATSSRTSGAELLVLARFLEG